MISTVKDRVFGEMEYKHAWIKLQGISLFGKEWQMKVMADAYTGERICEEQRYGYRYFLKHLPELSEQCTDEILKYVRVHQEAIFAWYPEIEKMTRKSLADFVTPRTALFTREGLVILLLDAVWDEENGIGVEVYPKIRADLQDAFL